MITDTVYCSFNVLFPAFCDYTSSCSVLFWFPCVDKRSSADGLLSAFGAYVARLCSSVAHLLRQFLTPCLLLPLLFSARHDVRTASAACTTA